MRLIEAAGFQHTAQAAQGLLGTQVQAVGVFTVEAAQPFASVTTRQDWQLGGATTIAGERVRAADFELRQAQFAHGRCW
ncbi:hypothetical protein D3C71_2043130 [compost metagenome]